MFDLTMEDFDLLTDEEFEILEQEVGRLTSCWKVSNTRWIRYLLGRPENRREASRVYGTETSECQCGG